jgi:hypothetical protein
LGDFYDLFTNEFDNISRHSFVDGKVKEVAKELFGLFSGVVRALRRRNDL